jgi:hypothetical protein
MSDIGLTRSNADDVLKEFYIPGMREQLNNEVFLLTQVEQNTTDIEGRRAVLALHTGRNEGVGARAELGVLPAPGRQSYAEERVPVHYLYGRMQLSGPVIRSMASDQGSFIRAVDSETTGLTRDLRNDTNRQVYGDGTGAIALLTSNAGAVVTVTGGAGNLNLMRQFRKGMRVDIGPAGNPVPTGTANIISVQRAAGTFTLDATIAVTAGHMVARAGAGGSGATQKELTGLKAQVSNTGVLWNVDPAVDEVWASYVHTGVGVVKEDPFVKASQEVNAESGMQLDLWITTADIHRGVSNLLTSIKRFPNTLELKGGYKGLDMSDVSQGDTGSNEVAMVWDKDMVEAGTAYGLCRDSWQLFAMSDWEMMQEDGAILSRVPNTDAYEGTMFRYCELATTQRNANAKLTGITVP